MTSNDYGYVDLEEVSSEFEKSESWSHLNRLGRYNEDTWGSSNIYKDERSAISFVESDYCPAYEEIFTGSRNSLRSELTHEEIKYANLSIQLSMQSQKMQIRQKSIYAVNEGRPFTKCFSSSKQKINEESLGSNKCDGHCDIRKSSWRKYDIKCWNDCRGLPGSISESVSGGLPNNETTEMISDTEKHKIETFFRGLGTDLFVSSSLANLYAGWKNFDGIWSYKFTGIPLILLDRGDTISRNKRRIQIMLAERGTCFPLWKDIIDNLTSYEKAGETFHTMHLSSNHGQKIGLSFNSAEESNSFYNRISELTSNPENINIYVPGSKKNKKNLNKKFVPLPHKEQISKPCFFEHVTSITAKDKFLYISFKTLLSRKFAKKRDNTL